MHNFSMNLQVLLLLLYSARDSFSTCEISWEFRVQPAWMDRIMEQDSAAPYTAKPWTRSQRRLWWRKPGFWRDEQHTHNGSYTVILRDDQWFAYQLPSRWVQTNMPAHMLNLSPEVRVMTGGVTPDLDDLIAQIPVIDPAFLLAIHDFQLVGEAEHAGRQAIRVRSAYRRNAYLTLDGLFWSRASSYELLVDRERGTLLRYAALEGDIEVAVASVTNVAYDVAIAEEIFSIP